MPYTVNFTDDNKEPIVVQDTTLDESTSIKLVGRDYKNYGEFIAENFVHILENFANSQPPDNPIEGQVWYDRSSNQLKIFTVAGYWRIVSGNFTGLTEPIGPNRNLGDIWYNTANKNLYVYDGIGWIFFAAAVIPDEGSEEGIPYVTLNTEQVITAHKEFAAELTANKITISNDNSGSVLLDLIDTSTPGGDKIMLQLTGNGNPLQIMNSNDPGDYEFRTGDTAIRINDGNTGVENLRRINGVWTTIFGVTSTGITGTSIATEAEARAKTSNTTIMTPARVYHAVDHFVANTVANGGIQSTQAEAVAGTANDVVMTPLRTKQFFDSAGLFTHAQFQLALDPAATLNGGIHTGGYVDRGFNSVISNTIPTSVLADSFSIITSLDPLTLPYVNPTVDKHILLPAGVYMIDVISFYSPTYQLTEPGPGDPSTAYNIIHYPTKGAIRTEANIVLLESSIVTAPSAPSPTTTGLGSSILNSSLITNGIITVLSPTKIKYSTWTQPSLGSIKGFNGVLFSLPSGLSGTPILSAVFDNIRIVKIG